MKKNSTTKILLADDDESIIDVATMMLEYMGYEVEATLDGERVPDIMQDHPDVVVLDVWMAGIDGRDICKKLKTDSKTADIPILMISAGKDVKASVMESGANDFLEKPFEMEALIEKIENLLLKPSRESDML